MHGDVMKKTLTKIIVGILCVLFVCTAFACGASSSFEKTKFKAWGKVEGNHGFIAETEKYVYFINGLGAQTGDNTFGAPVKGALMVADKTDLTVSEIAVPKLFIAGDYDSGLFLHGEGEETYVYYGTPNTEKDSSGNVAVDELVFFKTRLDGDKTTKFAVASALDKNYRFLDVNGTVYLVYSDNDKIIEFNTKDMTSKTVVEKDIKKSESLDSALFVKKGGDKYTVVYTVTCYEGDYVSDDSRTTATYNKVYAYKPGSDPVCILDGSVNKDTYKLNAFIGDYLFVGVTAEGKSDAVAYVTDLNDGNLLKIANTSYDVSKALIVSLDEIYVESSDDGKEYKTGLTQKDSATITAVANKKTNGLLFIKDGNLYYYNSDNKIVRTALGEEDGKEVIVVNEAVSTGWYAPAIIDGKLFYADDNHYIKAISLSAEEIYDEDNDVTTLGESVSLGKKIAADEAGLFTIALGKIYIEKDGVPTEDGIKEVQAVYDALSKDAKASVSSENLTKFENYKTAYDLAVKFYALKDIRSFTILSEDRKAELKTAYETAKTALSAISNKAGIRALISDNTNYFYQQAAKQFEA